MSLTIDITKFNSMLSELSARVGKPVADVTKAEVGSVLKAWAGNTKVAKPEILERHARKMAVHSMRKTMYGAVKSGKVKPREAYINWGAGKSNALGTGGIWWRASNSKSGKAVFVPIRTGGGAVPDSRKNRKAWPATVQDAANLHESEQERITKASMGAAGLARQSAVQIADSVGIRLEEVKGGGISASGLRKAREAIASNGMVYTNGTGKEYTDAKGTVFELVNNLPYCRRAKMDRGLDRAITGRMGLFRKNIEKGVFDSAATISKKYPNIFVQ